MKEWMMNAAIEKLAKNDLSDSEKAMLMKMMHIDQTQLDQMLAQLSEAVKDPAMKEQMMSEMRKQGGSAEPKKGFVDRFKGIFGR